MSESGTVGDEGGGGEGGGGGVDKRRLGPWRMTQASKGQSLK